MSENTNKKNCAHRWAQHIKQGIFRTSGSDEFRRTSYECNLWISDDHVQDSG